MSTNVTGSTPTDEDRTYLPRLLDALYRTNRTVTRLDVVLRAEAADLPSELLEIIELLPPGTYRRPTLCDQINSSLKGHGWTRRFGTVE